MAKQTFTSGQVLTAAQMNSLQANDYNQTVSNKTASYTLVAADVGTRIVMNVSGASTVTVNTNLFSAGDTLFIQNISSSTCTVTAGTCTVNTSGSLALAQWGGGTLYFTSASAAIFFSGTGSAKYKYHVFTSSGTLSVSTGGTMDLLAVGGGGGGGGNRGGGGGGGEIDVTYWQGVSVTTNQTITIGAAGVGSTAIPIANGTSGGNTTIGSLLTATGGGGGSGASAASSGGSGGGGSVASTGGGSASGTYAFAGGAGITGAAGDAGGGGGGASAVGAAGQGTASVAIGGNGGEGLAATFFNSNFNSTNFPTTMTSQTVWASGGGGGAYKSTSGGTVTRGAGGTGAGSGGLDQQSTVINTASAATMYGAGGGGGGVYAGNSQGGNGYQGLVIVRYLSTAGIVATGGQEVVTV